MKPGLRTFQSGLTVSFVLWCGLAVSAMAESPIIWIEGENATSSNMKPHSWYAGMVNKAELSGGGFISNFSPSEGLASYDFSAAQAGSYTFWIRANPVGDPKLDYQLNGAEWVPINFKNALDLVNLASDGKPDLRFIAWIQVGKVILKEGANTISFKFHSANNNHGSLDCFLFTQSQFSPNGKTKPGERLGTDEPGWWSFEPKPETFSSDALLDLSYLNEKEAGESGFLRADGDEFMLGNGKPVRFWAVNMALPKEMSHEQMDFAAARFAKLGINMVRLHGELFDRTKADPNSVNSARLDDYFYFINALKKKGIYVHLSTYFVLWFGIKPSDGIPGTSDVIGKNPFGLLFFEPRLQEIYKSWLRQVLTTRSPYSGKTLAEETSIGVFEIQNEDSLFFWTFSPANMGAGPRHLLEARFGAWLEKMYGSVENAFNSWPSAKEPDDLANQGLAGFCTAYEMSSQGFAQQSLEKKKRIADQVRFLAETQRDFYNAIHKYLREDLGAKWPISASNWITVPGLQSVERYTYSGVEVIDKHGYFGGKHTGDGAGWSVRNGNYYEDKSVLFDPDSAPFQYVHLPNHPEIQTEIAWNKPNRFIAEGEPLISAYESLQGVNGVFFFATSGGAWNNSGSGVWSYMMPGEIGQSPAEALQYRESYVKPGAVVSRANTSVDDLLNLRDKARFPEGANADFRANEAPHSDPANLTKNFDSFSYFVGKVVKSFDSSGENIATDLSPFIDRAKKIITSSTGEITWNYGSGLVTVNSPKSQAAIGFLKQAGVIKLGDVTIRSDNEYGAIHVISLDDAPLARSNKILIQAFTEEKMYGFKAQNGNIQDVGRPPITVRDIYAEVTFLSGPIKTATRLDEQGYGAGAIPVENVDGRSVVTLPKDSLYTIVTR